MNWTIFTTEADVRAVGRAPSDAPCFRRSRDGRRHFPGIAFALSVFEKPACLRMLPLPDTARRRPATAIS